MLDIISFEDLKPRLPWRASKLLGLTVFGKCESGISKEKRTSEMSYFKIFLLVGTETPNWHSIPEGLSNIHM